MNKPKPAARIAVLEALRKFPKAPTKTIAEHLLKTQPRLFANVEAARTRIRYYRGNTGRTHRAQLSVKDHVRPNKKAGEGSFPALPAGKTSFKKWGALSIPGPCNALVLSDIHAPYHDKEALEAAVERGKDCDLIILNGDIWDCFEVSDFCKDPRDCDFQGARNTTKQILQWLRAKFPDARIVYKSGNHEERLERYFITRAPAVLDTPEWRLEMLLDFASAGVELVEDKRVIRLGKLNVIHGHEHRTPFTNPVNPARGLSLKAKAHTICGHYHQSSQHSDRTLEQKVLSYWSTGCLCELNPKYMPFNQWSHGAAIVNVSVSGAFTVENFRIIEGAVY